MTGNYFDSFDGAKIYYHKTVRDTNKWLIFLHGFGGDLTAWQKERAYFSKMGLSSIALDLRGHGLSDRSDNKDFYKLENFAKDIQILLQKENIADVVLIGHCFGGMVSIYFQAQFPKFAKALVLVDTSFKAPFFGNNSVAKTFTKYMFELLLRFTPDIKTNGHVDFSQFVGTEDLNLRRIISDISHTSLRSYLKVCNNLVGLDARELLKKITVPTLIVEGTEDTIFPPDIAQFLNKRIKKSNLDLIEGANHIIVINNPKELETSIETFLKKINFI